MTWNEINKNYKKEGMYSSLTKKNNPELGNNWKNIMDSTNKLLWLFMISNESHKGTPAKISNEESST